MPMTWTCTKCQQEFQSFPPAERHANAAHHGARIAINVATRRGR